ncbi:MAG: TetR/AcrR family transcriptional regulator [Ilumatobacteraceae bacterium]
MATGTRDRILDTTAALFQRQGYAGTGLKQIARDAAAPFGSIYHFFPGGKVDLGVETIRRSGRSFQAIVTAVWDAQPDLERSLRAVFDGAAEVLIASGYADACPIATVALEVASTDEELRQATAQVFAEWEDAIVARLAPAGVPAEDRLRLARSIIALLEGGFLLSRASRSPDPMRMMGETAAALVTR